MSWAAGYVGIPFAPAGRDHDGCDCWGLARLVYREQCGVDLPSYADEYAHPDDTAAVSAAIRRHRGEWRRVDDPIAFDLIVMLSAGRPRHIGVVVEPGRMLHTESGSDACIERYDSPMWRSRIDGVYRRHG